MILIISGPTAVGKSHLCAHIEQLGVPFITPYTTRDMRPGERNGRDYHFVTKVEFQAMVTSRQIGNWDYAMSNYYGTSRAELIAAIGSDELYVVHCLARMAVRILHQWPQRVWSVSLMPESKDMLLTRLATRDMTGSERLQRELHIKEESEHAVMFDQVIPTTSDNSAQALLSQIVEAVLRSSSKAPAWSQAVTRLQLP
ncbi:hypothetical protein [Frigoribacterium sp. RIT-PI-h]|uniref:hypothetical protein n=1 Tax=Frigoribacterium sp. RIT-PI-h TaxID=1690245 RepID=UPI0009E8E814|nr:hypothetical protein [Frigoribacterium sp. RIT-PI-h]